MKLWQKIFLYTLILVMLAVSMTSILLLGFSLFHIVEFLNRETELWETNKPPAMQVCQHSFSLQ